MLNNSLQKGIRPYACLTVATFRVSWTYKMYTVHTVKTYQIWNQNLLGMRCFNCLSFAYFLIDGERHTNVGERTILDVVGTYKNPDVTTNNFFYKFATGTNFALMRNDTCGKR